MALKKRRRYIIMVDKADLHVHTTASDGLLKPSEVVLSACKRLSAIAITDHDTVQGLAEARKAGLKYKVSIIPGIELSCFWQGKECHLLGYHVQDNAPGLMSSLKGIKEARKERMEKMISKLRKLGIYLTWQDLPTDGERTIWGRPHLAQVLVEKKIVTSVADAFEKYLGRGRPAYVERKKLTLERAISIIKNAAGVPVIAHPGKSKLIPFLSSFKNMGIEGVEAYHPEHTFAEVKEIVKAAYKLGLFITGGSDFHGIERCGAPFVGFIAVRRDRCFSVQ